MGTKKKSFAGKENLRERHRLLVRVAEPSLKTIRNGRRTQGNVWVGSKKVQERYITRRELERPFPGKRGGGGVWNYLLI